MAAFENDPIGYAIFDRITHHSTENIEVVSDKSETDIFPVDYLFRTPDMMPELEQTALSLCRGRVLDVGAGAGCHTIALQKKGLDVTAIDTSAGAVEMMVKAGLKAGQKTIFDLKEPVFDTVLLLMNGIGLAGTMDNLPAFLRQLKSLLAPGGKIYCDSTDLSYLYLEEDGSMLIDLNDNYYGEMQFNMHYKDVESGWFHWLYIDPDNLAAHAEAVGLTFTLVEAGPSSNYLASLEHQS